MSPLTNEYRHVPVLLSEVIDLLDPRPGDVVCDCTLGGAGHTLALAERIAPNGLSIGIDQDDAALAAATARMNALKTTGEHRFIKGNFGNLDELLLEAEVPGVDCFLFDLGVSSPQLDWPERGFSYREDAPLDMRMDPSTQTLTAQEVVNTLTAPDLARIFATYGDEKHANRIAQEIVRRRASRPLTTTFELVDVITHAYPARERRQKHPAKKVFQALRIYVNGELDVLERGLEAAIRWLNPGGRIAVISYHSLEDRLVKHVFQEMCDRCTCPPDLPVCVCGNVPILNVITKRPVTATAREVQENPRARSAKLRAAVKLG